MRKVQLLLLMAFFVSSIASAGDFRNPEVHCQSVILIGWDGAQRSHVKESLGRGELPNLKKLACEGALVAIDIYRATDTKAGWAQILTGYEPEITGVFSNQDFKPIPTGYTIFERLENHFGAHNIVTAAVIGKKGNVGCTGPIKKPWVKQDAKGQKKNKRTLAKQEKQRKKPPGGKIVTENGTKYLVVPAQPYYETKKNMDVFINGLGTDEKVGTKALEMLEKYKDKRFFFFVHFAEVDHKGHKFGENSKEYNDALISADRWTGKIIKKLDEFDLYDKTLIYVTADHGFDEGKKGHRDAPYVFLATNDPKVIRRGTRADIAPTILERLGLKLERLEPPLDGRALTRLYSPPVW